MAQRNIITMIQENHPVYDPLAWAIETLTTDDVPGYRAARAERVLDPAGSRALTLTDYVNAAWSRVSNDGYHGPLRDSDWAEQDGRRPYDVATSLAVLEVASDAIDDYREFVYDGEDENGEPIEHEETTASAADIRRALFSDVVRIYGGLPW